MAPEELRAIIAYLRERVHLGPKEAEPALKLLEVEVEHLLFKVIGSLAIPGSMGDQSHPDGYFGDLRERPNEEDMRVVEAFVDDIMKKLGVDTSVELVRRAIAMKLFDLPGDESET